MARIYKRPDRSEYYIDIPDARGVRRRLAGYPSKPLTAELARRLEQLRDCRKAGMPPPDDARRWLESQSAADIQRWAGMELVDAGAVISSQPLRLHMEAWLADQTARRLSEKYIRQNRKHVTRLFDDMGAAYWHDLTKDGIRAALKNRADQTDASAGTSNMWLVSIRAFAHWCVDTGRAATNPVTGIKRRDWRADRRYLRRPLSAGELRRVIAAANASNVAVGRVTGRERALLYLVAASTGWRWIELCRLRRMDFFLEEDPPMITPPGWTQKSGRDDRLPLRSDVAELLRAYFAENPAPSSAPAFNMPRWTKGAQLMRFDLANTGDPADVAEAKRARGEAPLAPIPYVDERGRVADFHSLRHALATMIGRAGVPIKLAQTIMRHADPALTLGVYTHAEDSERAAVLEALPALIPAAPPANAPTPAPKGEAAPIGGIGLDWQGTFASSPEGENQQKPLQNNVSGGLKVVLADWQAGS
jgi:integrase